MHLLKRLLMVNVRNLTAYTTLVYITAVAFTVIIMSVLVINNLDINFIHRYYSQAVLNFQLAVDNRPESTTVTIDYQFIVDHNSETSKAKHIGSQWPPDLKAKVAAKVPERLWFLPNGTGRLTAPEAARLALWPEESPTPGYDRIVNQLLYVPLTYNRSQSNDRHKTIYLHIMDNEWPLALGRKEFLRCPVSTCQLVPRSHAPKADMIFFKSRYGFADFAENRKPSQIWAKFELESPGNIQLLGPDNQINWTVTYRHDSEVATPYYKYFEYPPHERSATNTAMVNYALNKTKKVIWFVSNCYANNKRLEYAKELAKHIQVDIYGRCGSLECKKSDNDLCQQMLDKDYKFYLSFENSNCIDYITEKFWANGLMHNIVPIAMGAHPSTYKLLAPPHSYIHVDDYDSPAELARYLHRLDADDRLYNQYFAWKGRGEIRGIHMWCRLCALLHAPRSERYYTSLQRWWSTKDTCVPITWTNMSIG